MSPADVVGRLIDTGVLAETGPDDELLLTNAHIEAIEGWRTRLGRMDEDARDGAIASAVDAPEMADRLGTVARFDLVFVSKYLALRDAADDFPPDQLVSVLLVLRQLEDPPPDRGAPDAAFPIRGKQVRTYTELCERTVVYVWRDDCDPCDLMRAELDEAFADGVDDVLLFAVYGSACSRLLREEYDIAGGPTTLFMRGGTVASRLLGAYHRSVIEQELDILREATADVV